jgi:phosphate-selective porin OprO/OprP
VLLAASAAEAQTSGLDIGTADGANRFQIGTVIQLDGRFGLDDPQHDVNDELLMRRVRPIIQARAAKYFEFRLMPDFGNHNTAIFDAYVDVRFTPHVRLRVGKDKGPVGLERLYSGASLLFPERTLVTSLLPNRDIGVQVQGDVAGIVTYSAGLFHGVADVASTDLAAGFGKDFNGRIVVRPFSHGASTEWRNLGVAVGATAGDATGALPQYRSATQQAFFAYSPAATADGRRTRLSPSAFYYYKSFGAFWEYARSSQVVMSSGVMTGVTNTAWEVSAAFVLTGETLGERGVVPARPLNPSRHHWGALDITARYNELNVDPLVFAHALAAPAALGGAHAAGIAAQWYASTNVKYVVSFERTRFDDSPQTHRPPENAFIFRLQLSLQPTL